MKLHFLSGMAIVLLGGLLCAGAGFGATLPPAETIANLNKAIGEAQALEQRVEQLREEAVDEAMSEFADAYEAAKTDAERAEVVREAREFIRDYLDEHGLDDLLEEKDEAFQEVIEQVDDAYDIDTEDVRGEPEFSQEVEGEGECYPNGRVRIGLSTFSSPGWLASTKKHEATHARQAAEGRWPSGAVERHDAELEAYGREITSADSVGLTDAERAEVQRRLHNHLEAKKQAMMNEIRAAQADMDTNAQREELKKIMDKVRDVIDLEARGDEAGAMAKKDHAIEELDGLLDDADEDTSEALEGLKGHMEELKEAELFVLKADTIEDLRDAREESPSEEATAEINRIIGKLKRLIAAQREGDEEKALEIKKDALAEVEALLEAAEGSYQDGLESAKEKLETLITLEEKTKVTGKAEAVAKDPSGRVTIMLHTPECRRYTVTATPGTKVKAGETVTVTGRRTEPGRIQASRVSVAMPAAPLDERKSVRAGQVYQGPDSPMPQTGALGSFVIAEETRVVVKANGASSSFFINEEKKPGEELEQEDGHFTGIVPPGAVALVTGGIIDALFRHEEARPPVSEGIGVPAYFDGVSNAPIATNVSEVAGKDMSGYRLLVEDRNTGKCWDYGSPDLSLANTATGEGQGMYVLGELPPGEKELTFTDPSGATLDAATTRSYNYAVQFRPRQVQRGVPVYGDAMVEGLMGPEMVQVSLSFDPVLGAEPQIGTLIHQMPGELTFQATAAELNASTSDFVFDTSAGLGEKQVNYVFSVLSE